MTGWSRQDRFTVRRVLSVDRPRQVTARIPKTTSLSDVSRESFNGVLKLRNMITESVGARYVSHGSGQTRDGRAWYRYTWERWSVYGARVSETIWIVRDAD